MTKTYSNMIDRVDDGGIAILSIDLRDRSMNVLDSGVIDAIAAATAEAIADPAVTGIVLTSGTSRQALKLLVEKERFRAATGRRSMP